MVKKRVKTGAKPWFDVLEAVRRLAGPKGNSTFTSEDVAAEAGIVDGEKSEARHIASAWLGKFLRWGYIVHAGRAESKLSRRAYCLTKWGATYEPDSSMTKSEQRGYLAGVEAAIQVLNKCIDEDKKNQSTSPEHRMKEIYGNRMAALMQAIEKLSKLHE